MRALWLRDGGCVMPGCPNRRLQAHHIVPWYLGGTTDLAGMALVCDREHTLLHEHGWTLEPDPDRPGLLHWRPPARPPGGAAAPPEVTPTAGDGDGGGGGTTTTSCASRSERPPIPACHAIDRDLGHTTPLW
jgi:hypothetical protein